jgi:hypothetical protein
VTQEITRDRITRALDQGAAPVVSYWPRNAYADWCPQPLPVEPPVAGMTALTVFTTYTVPTPPGEAPQYAAACVCGDEWRATSEGMMRRQLGEHRCVDQLGRAPGLLPESRDVAEATDDLLDRLLDGLRGLS